MCAVNAKHRYACISVCVRGAEILPFRIIDLSRRDTDFCICKRVSRPVPFVPFSVAPSTRPFYVHPRSRKSASGYTAKRGGGIPRLSRAIKMPPAARARYISASISRNARRSCVSRCTPGRRIFLDVCGTSDDTSASALKISSPMARPSVQMSGNSGCLRYELTFGD